MFKHLKTETNGKVFMDQDWEHSITQEKELNFGFPTITRDYCRAI